MSNFLTPGRLAERLSWKTELDKEDCARFSSELFDIIIRELKKDDTFSIFGFGTFRKSFVPLSTARNPQTGETINVPPHYRVKFSPAGKVAERINAEYADLTPIILETEERVKEGLLLKAERYIMTIQAEPEPVEPEKPEVPEKIEEASESDETENRIEEIFEKTVFTEAPEKEELPEEESAEASEECSEEPTQDEFKTEDEPDFEFQKEDRGFMKLILLSLLALVLILGIGWLIFRNIGNDGVTEIVVSQAAEEVSEPPAAPEEPAAVEEPITPAAPVEAASEALPESSYSIESGDSFSLLAQRRWGNIYLWPYLYRRNSSNFPDPDLVRPGDSIVIPPEPDRTRDQIRIEDSIIYAYKRYRDLIEEQSGSPRNPNRELSADYVLLGGERLYPDFLERRKDELRTDDIRRVQRLGE
ncbi:MAG: HU family DNA-binding protein [Spirochaetales bacterium]|nr:HU family DNA-binding protein [Spirochaetales bacterium]